MKNLFCILILFSNKLSVVAQGNLVPNGGFEEYFNCPNGISQVSQVLEWSSVSAFTTPDYFNSCSPGMVVSVPINFEGTQAAFDGQAYCGFYSYLSYGTEYREYIYVPLESRLIKDSCYHLTFYASLSEESSAGLEHFEIGFNSTPPIDPEGFHLEPETKLTLNGDFLDQTNWMEISTTFTAMGNENYLIFGSFVPDDSISLSVVQPNLDSTCYYYIDNVSIKPCYSETNSELNSFIPNVFTPNNDQNNDFVDFSSFDSVNIINRWGTVVYSINNETSHFWFGENFQNEELSSGVYYFVAYQDESKKTGTIHLIR